MSIVKDKERLLLALKESHFILAACRKTGIGKSTYYRWRQSDPKFAEAADATMLECIELVNDVAESNIINAVKEKDQDASKYWLRHRHPAYAEKVQIDAKVKHSRELSEEQKILIRKALRLASFNGPRTE